MLSNSLILYGEYLLLNAIKISINILKIKVFIETYWFQHIKYINIIILFYIVWNFWNFFGIILSSFLIYRLTGLLLLYKYISIYNNKNISRTFGTFCVIILSSFFNDAKKFQISENKK